MHLPSPQQTIDRRSIHRRYYFASFTLAALVVTVLAGSMLFTHTEEMFVFLLFWLFGLSCTAYAFLIGAVFETNKMGSLFGPFFFFG